MAFFAAGKEDQSNSEICSLYTLRTSLKVVAESLCSKCKTGTLFYQIIGFKFIDNIPCKTFQDLPTRPIEF